VEKVSKWDSTNQGWITRGGPIGPANFNVYPGQALLIGIKAGAVIASTAIVGNVPAQCPSAGCIRYGVSPGLPTLVSAGWSYIMIPLDKTSPTTADALKLDIDPTGMITKVSKWDANNQGWITRGGPIGPANFAVTPGYPYLVYASGTTVTTWPNVWP
jgi:hypothetical protein